MSDGIAGGDINASGRRRKLLVVALTLAIPAMVLLKLGFFFLALGMFPTILALASTRHSRRYVIGTVAAFNFAGLFPDLLSLTTQGGPAPAVLDRLSDVTVWAFMYGAGLLGWAVVWLSPAIARMLLEAVYKRRVRRMEQMQKKLEEEWGAEVKGRE